MAQRAHAPQDDVTWLHPVATGSTHQQTATPAGWIGGRPTLPDDLDWPMAGGIPAGFLAQINLSRLPKETWRGYGPQSGWLRVFLTHDGAPILIHSPAFGDTATPPLDTTLRWQSAAQAPRWDLQIGPMPQPPVTIAAPTGFDLAHPGCQPIDLATVRSLIAALHRVLDESDAFLTKLQADQKTPAPAPEPEQPGANGIWGNILRAKPKVVATGQRRIANPAILLSGAADVDTARTILVRLERKLEHAGDHLPPEALALICAALEHVKLPLFQTEAAPDLAQEGVPDTPIRIYQRNVPATKSAWAPRGTPRSRWAEDWQQELANLARAAVAQAPDMMPPAARAFWSADVAQLAHGATCSAGALHATTQGELATLLRLPSNLLTGWDWGAEALDFCLPLAALAQGDFTKGQVLWQDDVDPA